MKKGIIIAAATILLTLILDQWLKLHIKLNYELGESVSVAGDWFKFYFVENDGMAFGWKFPFLSRETAKILLTSFRIVAVSVILYYLFGLIKRNVSTGLIISISLIFAGAFGNIIDCILYGVIFSASTSFSVAEIVPFGTGYADILTGKVVDMFSLSFFPPIFNLADVAISVGVGMILVFQRKVFQEEFFGKKEIEVSTSESAE